jgi:hypothetical protein
VAKQVRADLALLEWRQVDTSTRRAQGSAANMPKLAAIPPISMIVGGSRARALIYIKRLVEGGPRLL